MIALPVHRIVLLEGARRLVAAALAGAASALAMPPFGIFPVLALTFPVLVWLLDGAGPGRAGFRAAAGTGFAFGFGYFLAGLWWIGAAFLVDAESFGWLMPFAVLGLPALLAVFPAFGCALAWRLWSPGWGRICALAFGLGLSEFLRGRLLSGFPWNEFGYALADNSVLGQSASILGVDGLTPLAILIFAAPAALADPGRGRWWPSVLAVGALALLTGFGAWRLAASPTLETETNVRIMQPVVQQDDKFRASAGPATLARYLALSVGSGGPEPRGLDEIDLLIWPESAFPFLLARTPEALAEIGALLPDRTILLTGAARMEEDGDGRRLFFNSIHALAGDGSIIATYDKVHLVPFGEYLPFQDALESLGLRQLTRLPGGFTPGQTPRHLMLPGGQIIAPLICYEAIFSTGTIDPDQRPGVLVNVTNDGWFGITPGPYQHLAQARVRAIEQGLPLLRAANTGISAVIDPLGRRTASLPLGIAGVLDAKIPAALAPTPFARFGLWAAVLVYIATIVGALVGRVRV
ncbi:apolipoprotein N-acyltransferase [Terrihabitans sp. B22-R8]|uniref:apolipoprotein N-acyltransferase n=1 Tax=Terrihabitans sp. B22-R8 TaxID=3425128 RepID=UPI00403CD054